MKFRATGPVSDQRKTGRIRTRQKLQDIGVRFEAPKKSLRFSALQYGKLRSTVHVATRMFSYDHTKRNVLRNTACRLQGKKRILHVTVTTHGLNDPGLESRQGQEISLLQKRPDSLWDLYSLIFNR